MSPRIQLCAATAASIVKKMVEQVARQDGIIVLTGTEPVFERFPRDVSPRFYQREPLVAGHLSRDETRSLLSAHARNREKFTETAIGTIRDLSGGNPREILRIAHEAWALSAGRPASVTDDILIAAAGKTGSLADRAKVARQMIDNVVARTNLLPRTDIVLVGGGKIDRLIGPTGPNLFEPSLAIVITTAADATQEAAARPVPGDDAARSRKAAVATSDAGRCRRLRQRPRTGSAAGYLVRYNLRGSDILAGHRAGDIATCACAAAESGRRERVAGGIGHPAGTDGNA